MFSSINAVLWPSNDTMDLLMVPELEALTKMRQALTLWQKPVIDRSALADGCLQLEFRVDVDQEERTVLEYLHLGESNFVKVPLTILVRHEVSSAILHYEMIDHDILHGPHSFLFPVSLSDVKRIRIEIISETGKYLLCVQAP